MEGEFESQGMLKVEGELEGEVREVKCNSCVPFHFPIQVSSVTFLPESLLEGGDLVTTSVQISFLVNY